MAVAALMGLTILAAPFSPAHAWSQPATGPATKASAHHAALKITPAEESDWAAVAKTMRDNAATMEKLASDKASAMKQGMTAMDDLQTYAQFAQAHVDGLKTLTASFQTLYNSMPDQQKKLADQVFQNSGRRSAAHSS
jgi:hypothetical protein